MRKVHFSYNGWAGNGGKYLKTELLSNIIFAEEYEIIDQSSFSHLTCPINLNANQTTEKYQNKNNASEEVSKKKMR